MTSPDPVVVDPAVPPVDPDAFNYTVVPLEDDKRVRFIRQR